jgi:hypothetical protein
MEHKYWILHCWLNPAFPRMVDERGENSDFYNPYSGKESLKKRIEGNEKFHQYRVPPPLKYEIEIETKYGDTFEGSYYDGVSLMRNDLIKAILSAGVDNIETFDAVVTDSVSGRQFTNYKYVHIIGETDYIYVKGTPDEEGFALNEEMMGNLHIARIKSTCLIVIDRVVRDAIEKAGIEDMHYKYRYSLYSKFYD